MPENITPQNDAELGVDEPESAAESPAQTQPAENPPKMPADAPPSLASQVLKRLTEAGFSEAELLHLMKPLRMAPKEATSLADVREEKLRDVLADWETCIERLAQEQKAATASLGLEP